MKPHEEILEFLGNACILILSVFSLFILIRIVTDGKIIMVEPNPVILWGEITVAVLMGILAIERLLDDLFGANSGIRPNYPRMTPIAKRVWGFIKQYMAW